MVSFGENTDQHSYLLDKVYGNCNNLLQIYFCFFIVDMGLDKGLLELRHA